jgi:hypothetical protein
VSCFAYCDLIDCSGRNSLIGSQLGLKQPYPELQKFSVFAHYENVDQPSGNDGTLTRMVRSIDRWYTQEFMEVFLNPQEIFGLVPTVNAILAGNEARGFSFKWRLWLFGALVKLQKRFSVIAPRLTLRPTVT